MNTFTLLVALFLAACSAGSNDLSQQTTAVASVEKAEFISEAEFRKLVMDYENNPEEWIFKGEIPTIVNFTADWCAPCRRMAPILDELAREYAGRVNIFKINVDRSRGVSGFFGVRNIPTMLFCRMEGLPALQPGVMNKAQLVDAIEGFLLKGE